MSLPAGLSPHKLRHTYASLLVCLGVDPGAVMDQLGHANAAFTLRAYRHAMRRSPDGKRQLAALVGARHWAPMGTSSVFEALQQPTPSRPAVQNPPITSTFPPSRRADSNR